jgi:hypothetical protein
MAHQTDDMKTYRNLFVILCTFVLITAALAGLVSVIA